MNPHDPGSPPDPPASPPPPGGFAPPPGSAPPPPSSPYAPPPSMSAPQPRDPSTTPPMPWLERSRLGLVTALIDTVKLIVTDPKDAFSRIRADGDYMSPFIFSLIISWPAVIIGQMWSFLLNSLISFGDQATMGFGLLQIVLILVLYPLIHLVSLFIMAGLYHVSLMIVSALNRSQVGFEGTFKVACYAMVSQAAGVVPIIGALIGLVAFIVFMVVGFERAHETSQGKAIVGVLIPLALCCLCVIVFINLMVTIGKDQSAICFLLIGHCMYLINYLCY